MEFDDLYRSEFPRVFRAAYAFTGNREVALEATQEAFSRALARWRKLQKEAWVSGWVLTTTLNCAKGIARKTAREMPVGPSLEGEALEESSVYRFDLLAALRRLPQRQRQAVVLFYFADHSIPVIAEFMHVSEGAVKSHLARARDALRAVLQDTESENSHLGEASK